jgi:hypothetical protein
MSSVVRGSTRILFTLPLVVTLVGCVGPTTPLGAVDSSLNGPHTVEEPIVSQHPKEVSDSTAEERASIVFSPSFQQVHGPYTWKIIIFDPSGKMPPELSRVRVYYNDLEVTDSTQFQFEVGYEKTKESRPEAILLKMPNLRLNTMEDHTIKVDYTTFAGKKISAHYPFPYVQDFEAEETIVTTRPFTAKPEIVQSIYDASKHYKINPVLLAALIAQESSFNPNALSNAKALGLTQITHLTERDISKRFRKWPRYSGISRISRRKLRRMIPKVINSRNEWRLDPGKSVWGGAYYLAYLRGRLVDAANLQTVTKAGGDIDKVVTEACLASYNSGLNRILYTINRYEEKWLEQKKTKEAKRYIRKILSYYGAFKDDGTFSL